MKKIERFSVRSFYAIKKNHKEGEVENAPPIRDRVKSIKETLINFLIWIKELSLCQIIWLWNNKGLRHQIAQV